MPGGRPVLVDVKPSAAFVSTPCVQQIAERALLYLRAGYAVHICGPSGTGKTTLALHLAAQLGRPVTLVYGDERFGSRDMVGGLLGYSRRRVVDNFIQSVLKTEEDVSHRWVDSRVTNACRYGWTLVYDEFTRSRPEANNFLLPVLEERILFIPDSEGEACLRVHPDFHAIFTSNPEEYAGVHRSQDALRDRMATIRLDYYDEETEVAITQARSGIPREDAWRIVRLVRSVREHPGMALKPTLRACVMIARALRLTGERARAQSPWFRQVCLDILSSQVNGELPQFENNVSRLLEEIC